MAPSEENLRSALDVLTLPPNTPQVESLHPEIRDVVTASSSWLYAPGVIGYGIGSKVSGDLGSPLALRVYVEVKRPMKDVHLAHRVPKQITVPGIADNVITDVVPIGRQILQSLTSRTRPAVPGSSIGPVTGGTGTFGCVVTDRSNSDITFLLTNSHVIAQAGSGKVGTGVMQPGSDDGGAASDVIATLAKWIPFNFEVGFNNLFDAAVARITDPLSVTMDIYGIGVPGNVPASPERGMKVQKTGRTSGHTTGEIQDKDYRTFMTYPKPGGGIGNAGFSSQVLCNHYTESGDSGALVTDMTGAPLGLHWCGSDTVSIFSPIQPVLDAFDVNIGMK